MSMENDGVSMLEKDHNEVRGWFQNYFNTSDRTAKLQILRDIIRELVRHNSAEEQYVYPLITDRLGMDNMIYEGHKQDEQIHKELMYFLEYFMDRAGPNGNPQVIELFDRDVKKLRDNVEDHMKLEETVLFPNLRLKLTSTELVNLGNNIKYAKSIAPTHPHPLAPQIGAKYVHPVQGMMDQAFDTLKDFKGQITGGTASQQQQQQSKM
ncbi:hypothetical protein ABK040_012906 [Willaertia magna]